MQENNENRRDAGRKFIREKGYYIVLFLCVAAIGISGYLFLSSALTESKTITPSMSVATQAEAPAPKRVSQYAEQQEQEDAQQTVSLTDEDVRKIAEQSVRVWPVNGSAQAGYSMEKLAYNATTQDWRTHDGLDISAVQGEPVMAAAGGVVSSVYEDAYLGTTVTISHDGGYQTQYSNLAPMPTVSVGNRVSAGEVIGAVGQTALLEIGQEPHLHFAVTCYGESVDPMSFLD